jgi:hypothetical protein
MGKDGKSKQKRGDKLGVTHAGIPINTGCGGMAVSAVSLVTYVSQPTLVSRSPSAAKTDNHTMKNTNLPILHGTRKQPEGRGQHPDGTEDSVDITANTEMALDPAPDFFPHRRGMPLLESHDSHAEGEPHDTNPAQTHYFSHVPDKDDDQLPGKTLDLTI